MKINVSPRYLVFLFILWIAPVVSAVWGWPVWATISLLAFFAIYALHEWVHVWICSLNNLDVESITLSVQGETSSNFELSDNPKVNADVFLAGAALDSICYTVSCLSAFFYAYLYHDWLPLVFGCSLIIVLIFNLAWPNSDWQHYMSYTRA